MDEVNQEFLAFNIWLLQKVLMWPKHNQFTLIEGMKSSALYFAAFYIGMATSFSSIIRQFIHFDDYDAIIDSGIALANASGACFVRYCFIKNIDIVKMIIHSISELKQYCPEEFILETESQLVWITKVMLVYLAVGCTINSAIPIIDIGHCRETRSPALQLHDPCGGLSRLYYPMEITSQYLILFIIFLQTYSGLMICIMILLITMMLIGLVMHISAQLRYCRKMMCNLFNGSDNPKVLKAKLHQVIQYHQKIILCFEKTNDAFKLINITYIFLISLVLSILGFKVLIVANVIDSIRYSVQLFAWMIILLLVCYYGQKLTDESVGLAEDAYFVPWYLLPVTLQKDLKMVMMRSQKCLQLSAANLGFIAFPALLKALKSAYSLFTLLLNTRKDSY